EASAALYTMGRGLARSKGFADLPMSLSGALDVLESSPLMAEVLGEHIHEWFLRNKRAEFAEYRREVTPFELRRYLNTW
ncbi:MAG: glutamine synthetase, partial [bacterium]|nr:glutamine synthetase [bacterium]